MAKHTVLFTFGTAQKNATRAVLCPSLPDAMRCAEKAFEQEHHAPLREIAIRPGDHTARLINMEWAWPSAAGWES